MNKNKKLGFPHMGNYYIPIKIFIESILPDFEICVPPKITKKTLELGSRYSPDFVCTPFKYNLGNFIESLENGANVLTQAGGGCRFGYYGEVQKNILEDLGYKFDFISLVDANKLNYFQLYKTFKKHNKKLSLIYFTYRLLFIKKMIKIMDNIDTYIRENIGFECEKNSFEKLEKSFLEDLKTVKTFRSLNKINRKYNKLFKRIKIDKPKNPIKIGIVGELYGTMEPFSNYYMERELAKKGIEVKRFIDISFLLFDINHSPKRLLKKAGKYLKYHLGADGTSSVAHSKMLAENNFDGIVHLKPFGCIPEIDAIPMLQEISKDYKIPIIYFSFDSQTSETGIKTRLEAFYDMIMMKKGEKL